MIDKKLTPKQEKFCQNIAKGMSQYDSYKDAYNVAKTTKRETVDNNAYETSEKGEIKARIKNLRESIFSKSIEKILNEIEAIKEDSLQDKERKIALDCLKEQGKLLGYYTDKIEHSGDSENPLAIINVNPVKKVK